MRALLMATALLGLLAGCRVPTNDELNQEKARSCDAEHSCLPGYACVEGHCQPEQGTSCRPGTSAACGPEEGECRSGKRTCGENGTYGSCEGATMPTAEVYNAKDDDCDGIVDEEMSTEKCTAAGRTYEDGTCGGCLDGHFENGSSCQPKLGLSQRCTEDRMCGSGYCVGGFCCDSACADSLECRGAGVCSTGTCTYPITPDAACDDGIPCTIDRCTAQGECKSTVNPCNTPPSQCYASPGTCNDSTGVCEYNTLPSDSPCNDGNACTTDKCNGSGTCISMDYCPPPNECKTGGSCATDGSCQFTVDTTRVGKVCHEAGNTGTCLQDGTCQWFKYAVTNNFNPADIATNNTLEDLNITCGATFYSTERTWIQSGCSFATPMSVVTSADVVVIPVRNLTVNAPLRVVGARPVILAVYGDATLNSEIRANSVLAETQVGAGSGVGCSGRTGAQGAISGDDGSGGGGGGLATNGGNGGANEDGTGGGGGGVAAAIGFSPLIGGCKGGDGAGPNPTTPGVGGAGGGALQISVAGRLILRNGVSVSGAGGTGGTSGSNKTASGGGGGSGGLLVLEADQVVVDAPAILTANGGGGGEGASIFSSVLFDGRSGSDGSTSSNTRASGGAGNGDYGGDGGLGAAGTSGPASGGRGGGEYGAGGGGGGAAGRILLRGVTSCSVDTGSIISPSPIKTGGVCL